MAFDIPTDLETFQRIMLEIDSDLATSEVPIFQRPIRAMGEVSRRFKVTLTIGSHPKSEVGDSISGNSWSDHIHKWYEQRYGERIKTNFSPGRIAIVVEEDIWAIRIGQIFGSVVFTVSRTRQSERMGTEGRPAIYNVLDAIEEMPSTRWHDLPDAELEHIYEKFMLGAEAFSYLDGSADMHELVGAANGDLSAAVHHLVKERPEYGLSKWASLQAAEKMLKVVIALNGQKFPRGHEGHDLSKLAKYFFETGAAPDEIMMLLEPIQCSAGIRYGEIHCGRDEAVLAHNACLGLIVALGRSSSVLRSNLALQPTGYAGG